MKNVNTLKKEIEDLLAENKLLEGRLEKTTEDSAKLFLQNIIQYNIESINNLNILINEKNI